jgi:hypothetical protein
MNLGDLLNNNTFWMWVAIIGFLIILFFILRPWVKVFNKIKIFGTSDEYILVIGMSRMAMRIAHDSRNSGKKVVFISELNKNTLTDELVNKGVKVINVKTIDEESLIQAGVNKATSCLILSDDDEYNISVANFVADIKKKKGGKTEMDLLIHIQNWYTRNLLVDQISNFNSTENLTIRFFDFHYNSAKLVYDLYPPHKYVGDQTQSNDEKVICVIGKSKTSESFLLENAVLSQFRESELLKILVFSKDAEQWVSDLKQKFPFLDQYLEMVPVELLNNSFSSHHQWDSNFKDMVLKIDAAYFFGHEDAEVVSAALHFKQFIYNQVKNIRKVPLVVVLPDKTSVFKLLASGSNQNNSIVDKYKDELLIHFVREVYDSCTYDELISQDYIEIQAKAINYFYSIKYEFDWLLGKHFKKSNNGIILDDIENNYLYFKVKQDNPLAQLEALVIERLVSYTKNSKFRVKQYFGINEAWNRVTERNKESNRYIARHLPVKNAILRELKITDISKEEIVKNIGVLAPVEHNRWSAEKLIAGFAYGELPKNDANLKGIVKNTLKVHDQLDRFDNLNHLNKEKDIDLFLIIPLLENIRRNM